MMYPKVVVLGAPSGFTKHSESTYPDVSPHPPLSDRCGSPLPPPHAPPASLTHQFRGCAPTHQCCVSVYPDSGCRLPHLHSWAEIPLDSHLTLRFPSQHPHTHPPTHPYPATVDQCLPRAASHTLHSIRARLQPHSCWSGLHNPLHHTTTPHHTHTHTVPSLLLLSVCVCVLCLS